MSSQKQTHCPDWPGSLFILCLGPGRWHGTLAKKHVLPENWKLMGKIMYYQKKIQLQVPINLDNLNYVSSQQISYIHDLNIVGHIKVHYFSVLNSKNKLSSWFNLYLIRHWKPVLLLIQLILAGKKITGVIDFQLYITLNKFNFNVVNTALVVYIEK